MNVPLLLKVREKILKYPGKFNMETWDCGTTACIGGWAARISGEPKPMFESNFKARAAKILDLEYPICEIGYTNQATKLFGLSFWPDEFYLAYEDSKTSRERAEVAACRIDYFIATGE